MIPKVYEVDPMVCPKCGGQVKVFAFITEVAAVDRIMEHRPADDMLPVRLGRKKEFVIFLLTPDRPTIRP